MFDPRYEEQARLLLRCLPEVAKQECLALKGGTAINLFLRDLPRLSVDVDLTYVPLKTRDNALVDIAQALYKIKGHLLQSTPEVRVQEVFMQNQLTKLLVLTNKAQVKIEPNLVLRGTVAPPETRDISQRVQDQFKAFVSMQTLSVPDLYGGKLCAALDRQHPRDLFDIKLLFEDSGMTSEIRRAFVVYIASHPRPMNELLNPRFTDIASVYQNQFVGMSRLMVPLQELSDVRERIVREVVKALDEDERAFLLSMKSGEPAWDILGIEGLARMPALQWKLINIRKMNHAQRAEALERLRRVLEE
jgi:predicted nucleotidyltransferase component of viral defense system